MPDYKVINDEIHTDILCLFADFDAVVKHHIEKLGYTHVVFGSAKKNTTTGGPLQWAGIIAGPRKLVHE